tara:strand:- start:2930 stop:3388 length:459 start_codon:yes stop_codon:yes gene_type:complete
MDKPYILPHYRNNMEHIYKTTENWIVPNPKKKKRSGNRCYTCNPSGEVLKHVIEKTENFSFHHDMWRRPMIIVTPNVHYHTITDIPIELQKELWETIKNFLNKLEIHDYQCLFNNGDWQTHHHFHVKLRFDEKKLYDMRKKHFHQLKTKRVL